MQAIVQHEQGREAVSNYKSQDHDAVLAALEHLAQQSDRSELQLAAATLLPLFVQLK